MFEFRGKLFDVCLVVQTITVTVKRKKVKKILPTYEKCNSTKYDFEGGFNSGLNEMRRRRRTKRASVQAPEARCCTQVDGNGDEERRGKRRGA